MTRRDFGRYKIAEEVGRGAMGVVYRALDPVVRRTVAVKAINTAYLEGIGVKASEYFERFRREAEVAGRLNHPAIVKLFDLGPDYLVMEFIEGQSLASMLMARIRLPPDRILQVVTEVAGALDHAHREGIVHRDVKPANIMIQPDGAPKVMDFGLARIESSTLTAAGEILGSASYMAPEVILGRSADARSDIFSLGVVAYEMMTGERPFGGASISVIIQNIVRTSPRPAREVNLNLPPEYDGVFERVLAKEPAARYATAGEFAAALNLRRWEEPAGSGLPTGAMLPELGLEQSAPTLPGSLTATLRGSPPPPAAADEPTQLKLEPGETPAAASPVDAGGQTVMMVEAREVEESPLGALVDAPPSPATVVMPTLEAPVPAPAPTPPPSSEAPSPELVAAAEPTTPAPRGPTRRGIPLVPVLIVALAVLLGIAVGVSFLAYRYLVRRAETLSSPAARVTTPAAAPETPAPGSVTPEPTAPETPAAAEPALTPPTTAAPATARLEVASEPPGARVTIGKKARGVTPLRLELPPGRLSLIVEKEGFRPWRKDVALPLPGLTLQARLERLPREPAPAATPTPAAVKAGDLVPLGPDVMPPRKLYGETPEIPKAASKLKLAGSVLVEFIVDEQGRVAEAKVIESAGELLDKACLDAVRRWRYEAAATQGVNVKVALRARFTFQSR